MTLAETLGVAIFGGFARAGTLHLTLPSGEEVSVGSGRPIAEVGVGSASAVSDMLRAGVTGFAEAHMDGRIETPDLPRLLQWAVANQQAWFDHPVATLTAPLRKIWQRARPEVRHPRIQSMNDHYNLSNDFYRSWLDDTMTYSSARFTRPDQSLSGAQLNKYRTMADHAGLRDGMRVLEIGCGWGGFTEYAAEERGCDVVGITLSEEQAAFARKRIAARGLTDKVAIDVRDFRDVDDDFDAVVSIEMIESIDESQWPALFRTISRCLRPGAIATMQIITIADDEWRRYRSRTDFIQQYIFPGGQLPAPKVLTQLARKAGLTVEQVETFGLDYARTLAAWRGRFEIAWPDLRLEHDLDERFHRMWILYLSLCEAGFRMGRINVEQWVFTS